MAGTTKMSRILWVYYLFRCYREVSFQELRQQCGVSERTSLRDIRLLERAGVLEVRYDRKYRAFYPVSLELRPMAPEENRTRKKYMEKLRRLCILMTRLTEEPEYSSLSKSDLYREVLPGISDRTRQRDFKELQNIGFVIWHEEKLGDEPRRWIYESPCAY